MSCSRRSSMRRSRPTFAISRDEAGLTQVRVRRLDPDVKLPARRHPGDAGYDLCARTEVELAPAGGRALVPTGLAIAIPDGYAGFVQPRSFFLNGSATT